MSTPVMVAVACGAVLLGMPVLAASQATVAASLAASAADSAALAGADAMLGFLSVEADPCEMAQEIADAVGGALTDCEPDEERFEIRVRVAVRAGVVTVAREARAGPARHRA